MRKYTDEDRVAKILGRSVVNNTTGCFEILTKGSRPKGWYKGKNIVAARCIWMSIHGELAPDVFVCHHCDNPKCVNPAHLYAGTPLDNMRDKEKRGRNYFTNLKSCPRGHEYNYANTRVDKNGHRHCKKCAIIHNKARQERKNRAKLG